MSNSWDKFAPSLIGLGAGLLGSLAFHLISSRSTHSQTPSSEKKIISSENVAKAIGPYSHATTANGFIFLSGQLGLTPSGNFISNDIQAQTKQALDNIGEVLKAAGSSYDKVVKTTILLKNIEDFPKVNEVYGKYFPTNPPARATYAVAALPKDGLIEIEAIAKL